MTPAAIQRVEVATASRSYEVVVGFGLLADPRFAEQLPESGSSVIVTDGNVGPLYAERLEQLLPTRAKFLGRIVVAPGERSKDPSTLLRVLDEMFALGCDRATTLYALGGGVVGDIAGFAAACFMRGIDYVQVPTTLLAQVDSSVGGKTGINHRTGKNLIGAFHQPRLVVADLATLTSLPRRELMAGLGEVIKYGAACDASFFQWIEQSLPALLAGDQNALVTAVRRSCEIKAEVVGADEFEAGRRAILNFGHTFAHALESELGYGRWLHGEAVGCGMVMAADLSSRRSGLGRAASQRISDLVARAGLPVSAPPLLIDRLLESMRGDKKSKNGEMRFVLLQALGEARVDVVDSSLIREVLAVTIHPA